MVPVKFNLPAKPFELVDEARLDKVNGASIYTWLWLDKVSAIHIGLELERQHTWPPLRASQCGQSAIGQGRAIEMNNAPEGAANDL